MKRTSSLLIVLMLMLASFTAGVEYQRGDVDQDGKVSISDVTTLINYLLTNQWPADELDHEWVDMGLPSGTLWATCNVGASCPEEYGDYFAWGETESKEVYNWSTYKWLNDSDGTMIKYCTQSDYGTIDNKTELDPEDDAAYVNWGPSWRMPTLEQIDELINNCSSQWTTQNGVNGRLFTGPNGNSLFLPAAGYIWDSSLDLAGTFGGYWSRTLQSSYSYFAYYLDFRSGSIHRSATNRSGAIVVRAVRVSQN